MHFNIFLSARAKADWRSTKTGDMRSRGLAPTKWKPQSAFPEKLCFSLPFERFVDVLLLEAVCFFSFSMEDLATDCKWCNPLVNLSGRWENMFFNGVQFQQCVIPNIKLKNNTAYKMLAVLAHDQGQEEGKMRLENKAGNGTHGNHQLFCFCESFEQPSSSCYVPQLLLFISVNWNDS